MIRRGRRAARLMMIHCVHLAIGDRRPMGDSDPTVRMLPACVHAAATCQPNGNLPPFTITGNARRRYSMISHAVSVYVVVSLSFPADQTTSETYNN
jgi:hypothetical protein